MSLQTALENLWGSDYVQKNPTKAYKTTYATEYAAVAAYLNGGPEPAWAGYSKLGKGLCEVEHERRAAAPPPPPPPPPPDGSVIFDSPFDALSSGQNMAGIIPPWSSWHAQRQDSAGYTPRLQCVASDGAITPRKGAGMLRCEVQPGDYASWTNGREVTSLQADGLPSQYQTAGADVYMGWSMFLKSTYKPTNVNGDYYGNAFVEWHGDSAQEQAPFHFGANGHTDQYFIDLHTQAAGWNPVFIPDVGPLIRGRWADFVVHHRWRKDTTGLVEFWINGTKVFTWSGKTWGAANDVYPELMQYRSPVSWAEVIYFDCYRVGTSYEAVAP